MSLAESLDVEAALGREITEEEQGRVENLLNEASDLVAGYLGCGSGLSAPYPDPVIRATASMVAAVILRPSALPQDADQVNAGIYGVRFTEGSTSGGPWLTNAIRQRLDPYRCSSGGSVSMATSSERFSVPEVMP